MGQYYRPVILKHTWKKNEKPVAATLLCYDYEVGAFGIGAKLMEHSYVGNDLVEDMVALLGTKFKGYPFVWVGDYADAVEINGKGVDLYNLAGKFIYEDYNGESVKKRTTYKNLWASKDWYVHDFKYLVNYTKKEYCVIPPKSETDYVVHPLPLLTSSGNGRGGGDYGINDPRVGRWAFDKIGATNDSGELEGFTEIDGKFKLDC